VPRRTVGLVVLVAAIALVLPAGALAAGAALRSPADGVVNGPTSLDLRITREPYEAITAIDVGLRRGDAAVDGGTVERLCEGLRECPNADRAADYRIAFDPRTGAPFLSAETARILPNGSYELRVGIELGHTTEQQALPLTLSVPPSTPTDVRATVSGPRVGVRWSPAPEPDVAGYRVERSTEGGGWTSAGEVASSATDLSDAPGPGSHRYRVVALRPDGKGGTYEVTSRDVQVTVAGTARGDAAGPAGGDPAEPDAETEEGRDPAEGGDGDGTDAAGEADVVGEDADVAATGPAGAAGPAGAWAPRAIPTIGLDRRARTPTMSGDDPGTFRETLAYDGAERVDDRRHPADDGEVLLSVPGAGAFGGLDGDRRLAVPFAAGLLMTATGLHLWRWVKLPLP
jgi:hypothetical protein